MVFLNSKHLVIVSLVFLAVTVPLIPYRYLFLPVSAPPVVMQFVQNLPVVVIALGGAAWFWERRKQVGFTSLPLAWPVTLLFLAGLLSSVGAQDPLASTAKTCYYFLTGGLLYFLALDLTRQQRWARFLLHAFAVAACVAALYGVLEFALGRNILYGTFFRPENEAYRRLIPDPWFGRRISGTIGHPVVLGMYLVLTLPLVLHLSLGAAQRRFQVLWGAGTLILVLALVLTFSRGAWLAALVGLGVYLKLRSTKHLLMVSLILGLFLLGVLAFSGVYEVLALRLRDAYDNYWLHFASTSRGQSFAYVAVINSMSPFLGLGTGMYRFAAYDLRAHLALPAPLGVLDTPDNMYLMWLAETGLVGLVAAVYVIALLFRHAWQRSKCATSSVRQDLARAYLGTLAGFCIGMLTCDALYFPVTRTAFWLLIGVVISLLVVDDKTNG